jgi:hypothetical protein
MAAVYRAEHRLMDRPVGLKVIRGDLVGSAAMVGRCETPPLACGQVVEQGTARSTGKVTRNRSAAPTVAPLCEQGDTYDNGRQSALSAPPSV